MKSFVTFIPDLPRRVRHAGGHLEQPDAAVHDPEDRLPPRRLHSQAEVQRQSTVPVLSHSDGVVPGAGERALLRHLLPAQLVQRRKVSRLADPEPPQAAKGSLDGLVTML
jgi:hypothetical protein